MRYPHLSIAKWLLAAVLVLTPAIIFFALSEKGSSGATAQAQIFHGGTTWVDTEIIKIRSFGNVAPAASLEDETVEEILENLSVEAVEKGFAVRDRPDTRLLKLEYTNDDPATAMRVLTSITNMYMSSAAPLVDLEASRHRFSELEDAHIASLEALDQRIETLEVGSADYVDATWSRDAVVDALQDVAMQRSELGEDNRSTVGSEVVANPFLVPATPSNALRQTLLGLGLGALLAGTFLLVVRYGEGRSTENLSKRSANVPEAPQAFRQ